MNRLIGRWACAAVCLLGLAAPAAAGPAAELAEWMLKQGAKFADDIAGKGGRELAAELEELSVKAGDDVVEQLVKRGGPGALRSVRELGERAPDAARLIARHGPPGKLVVEQGRAAAVDVFREFGDDGVKVLVREGSSAGGRMLAVYGRSLAESADKLAPQSMAHLRHWLPEVERAPSEWRSAFCDKLRQGGDDFVVWVHRRWKELATAGGLTLAAITAYKLGDGAAETVVKVGDRAAELLPDPARDPLGWAMWWLPALALAAIAAAAWVARGALRAWLLARRPARP